MRPITTSIVHLPVIVITFNDDTPPDTVQDVVDYIMNCPSAVFTVETNLRMEVVPEEVNDE